MKLDLRRDVLILDGPTGTELIARGFAAHPVLWTARAALERPELLRAIHADYLAAGADLLTANTFRTSAYTAEKAGLTETDARLMTEASVALAFEAVRGFSDGGGKRFVLGSMGPLEDCYQPRLVPPLATIERSHALLAEWLVGAGCDGVIVETMGTAREALVATRAALKAGAATVLTSFITGPSGVRLLGGDRLVDAARACAAAGASAVLVNCVHADVVELALAELKGLGDAALGAYANASRMRIEPDGVHWDADPRPEAERAAEYATRAQNWRVAFGATILGSCCGTTPAYIRALSKR